MIINNKRGSAGKEWIYALSIIFALTFIYIIFNGIFNYNLAPVFIDLMPATDAGDAGIAGIQQYLLYWKFIPFLILGGVIIYMFIVTVRKEPTEYY